MTIIEALHSMTIGGLIVAVWTLRKQVRDLQNPPRPSCEMCDQPASGTIFSLDESGVKQIRLCAGCFNESLAASAREMLGDDE